MFVTSLDRPWEGTPFLLQGFLINEVEQIKILRELCKKIVIDPRRSTPDSLGELIDLYILPEETQEVDQDEPKVRIRFVDSNRKTFDPNAQTTPSLARIRANVAATLKGIFDRARADTVRPASPAGSSGQTTDESNVSIPRFSATQVFYAPSPGQSDAIADTSRAARRALARENRFSKPVSRGDEARSAAERLERFEALMNALRPDMSSVIPGIEFLRWLISRLLSRSRSKAPGRGRAIRRRPRAARESSIPRSIDLVIYRDRVGVQAEVPRAREAVATVEETLGSLTRDLATEASIRVDGLPVAVSSLVESIKRNGDALIWVARVRNQDAMAYTHSIKVASYLLAFGRHLGFPAEQLSQLAQIGLLMDVGKMDVDAHILNKRDSLTPEEFERVKVHVEAGLRRLSETMHLHPAVYEGIAHHHEWINGEGYPFGLAGDEISIFGRMTAIVDAYAALTTARPYAPPLSSYEALQVIYSQTEKKFHAPLVEQFVRAIGLFPVGSLVLLSSEEVAVVTSHDKSQRLEPRVLVLTTPYKHALPRPYELDLTRRPKDDAGKPIRILRSLPAGVHGIDFRNFYIA
jgi:HD-GYP domain-containing protein (c-di-GMP phosphodiesterase class II)